MKRFLSLMLAVLMVVSMAPMFAMLVGAEGTENTVEATDSEFPNLIITEVHPNSINFNGNQPGWVKDAKIGDIFYPTYAKGENYYYARNLATGAALDATKDYELVEKNGAKVFELTDDSTAKEGVSYYRVSTNDLYDVFSYIEIYNSGTEPVNLYDYKLVYDRDATYDANSDVKSTYLHAGGVQSTFHKSHFEKVVVKAGESVNGYYTSTAPESFTPCATDAVAEEGTVYYRQVKDEYYVENPETAELRPGECAVIWFYTWEDWATLETVERFKAYYEWRYSVEKRGSYGVDFSNTLVLTVDGWNDYDDMFGVEGAWKPEDDGSRIYGIAKQTMTDTVDTARYSKWESWVYWSAYAGINTNKSLVLATVSVGSTTVTGGTYAVYNEDTGLYSFPTAADGTADAYGKAVLGVTYYTVDLSTSNSAPMAHKNDTSSANYLYGFNATAPLKEGWPYTITNYDLNPGILTNVQKDVLPNGRTETAVPDLVITEVCPDNIGSDAYEYVEVTNTSGVAINIFDYTFLARTSSYQNAIGNEYFNRFNTIIPGNVGNILAADPGSYFYDEAPTNPDYEGGWLQPGEVAVLWSYYSDTYAIDATFEDFYDFYGLDSSVKVFAMDSDNSSRSGRPNERQNLGNTDFYMYGIARNDDLQWYSEPYVSNVVMAPVTFVTGVTQKTALGIPLSSAVSYVFANSVMVSGTGYMDGSTWKGRGLGEDYGYQYVWDRVKGTNNKFGALMDIAKMTRYSDNQKFVMTGTVTDDNWRSSPGRLTAAQKTSMTTNKGAERYVVYMQDFDNLGNVAGYDEVAELLGITGVNNDDLAHEHKLNVKETEKKGMEFLEVRDGKLYINNYGSSDDYMQLMSDDILNSLRDGNFTVEFSMTYDASMINSDNGYSTILYNFNGEDMSYGAPIIRVSGFGNNAVFMKNQMYSIEDAAATANAGVNMNGTDVTGSSTLYERLTGKDISTVTGSKKTLDNTIVLAGKTLNVKVDVSITTGVTVTVNDIVVSKSFDVVDSAMFSNWGIFMEQTVGTDLVLKTTPNVSVSYDYITVYTDAVGLNANDLDIGSLYITELSVSGGTWRFRPDDTGNTGLGWIEYIEITNGSNEPVALKDYTILSTSRTTGLMHEGNNIKWMGDDANRGNINLSEWLGRGDNLAQLKEGDETSAFYNPSQNAAILQPGESAVVFTVNGNTSYTQTAYDRSSTDYVTAARSWLQLPDSVLCIVVQQWDATVVDVDPVTKQPVGTEDRISGSFAGWDRAACVYGIGRNVDAKGNEIDWQQVYTHDYRNLESFVNFQPFISVGQNNTGYSDEDTGLGGEPLAGYSSHYTYGLDAGSYYKQGTSFTRRNTSIMTTYKDDNGTVKVDKSGQYNVGKLYQIQETAFENLRSLIRNGYKNEGGLVITEYVPHSNDSKGTNYQAFEAMEITNTSDHAINLYNYSLAKTEDGTYGNPRSWHQLNTFKAGAPVSKTHRWYDQLKNLSNPEDGTVQPGESVVIWLYIAETYNYAAANGLPCVTFEDFRNYYAARGNDVIAAKNSAGQYTTKVIVVTGNDSQGTFNLWDTSTTCYGIAKKTVFEFGASDMARAGTIVSWIFSPHYSMYYDLAWKKCQLNPNLTYLTMPQGGTLATSFGWDELLVDEVDMATDTNLVNLCVRNEDGTYSFASAPYDTNTTYYKLYFYANVQTVNGGVDDMAYNFVYGNTLTSGWNVGGVIGTVKADYYMFKDGGARYSTSSADADATPRAVVNLTSLGVRDQTLGYLIEDQKSMVAEKKFDFVGEFSDGTKVYFYETVMGDLDQVNVLRNGASVSFGGSGTEITFAASTSVKFYNALVARFGASNVSVGMITTRAEDAMKANMIRPAMLDRANVSYTVDDHLRASIADGRVNFYSSAQKMQSGYYSDTYSSLGYVKFGTCMGDITLYGATAESRSAKQVLASAIEDYSEVRTDEYCYAVASGKWSRYTAEQRERFEQLCAR